MSAINVYRFPASRARSTAHTRLACAIAASAALHAWIVATGGVGAGRETVASTPFAIAARLAPPAAPALTETESPRQVEADTHPAVTERPAKTATRLPPGPDQTLRAESPRDPHPNTAAASGAPGLLPDPVYYPVRQLDVLPALQSTVRLDYPERAARDNVGGQVLVMLMIDEAGMVNDVTVMDARPAGYFEDAVRGAFSAARFSPARKAERPVKSRVLISVSYNPSEKEGTLR